MQIKQYLTSSSRTALVLVVIGILIAAVFIAGCTAQPAPAPVPSLASIGEIVKDPAAFEGKEVAVKGKIASECGSGCWFMLDDGTGIIYVDLSPNNFAIPQLQGSEVIVRGTIHISKGDPSLHAATVATKTRTYP